MRVLVTGHEGYLGSVVVPILVAAGHDVVGLDAGFYTHGTLGPPPEDIKALRMDVRDVRPEHCDGMEAVVHLAALPNDPVSDLEPRLTEEVNHAATLRLARAARAAGVTRFLFTSSCSVYGAAPPGPVPLEETARPRPVTPYDRAKVRAEWGLRDLANDRFCPVLLRTGTAYGFSPRLRGDLIVNELVGRAVLTGEVLLRSDGLAWRPLVHVEDVGAAVQALLGAPVPRVRARTYHVGRPDANQLTRDIARTVVEAVPGSRVRFAAGATADPYDHRVDCRRIATEVPGFRPRWTLRAGIAELVEAYRRHRLVLDDLAGPRYRRVPGLSALRQAGRVDRNLRWVTR